MQKIAALSVIFLIAWNYLANTSIIYPASIGDISRGVETLFTPAGYAFAIWGLIYLGIGAHMVREWFQPRLSRQASQLILLQSVLNGLWIHAFLCRWFFIAFLLLLGLAITLALLLTRLNPERPWRQIWGLYGGWVLAATFVNGAIFLNQWGLGNYPDPWFTSLCLLSALGGGALSVRLNSFLYAIAVAWALLAIAIYHYGNVQYSYPPGIAGIFLLFFRFNLSIREFLKGR
jgi:hypothetical protein